MNLFKKLFGIRPTTSNSDESKEITGLSQSKKTDNKIGSQPQSELDIVKWFISDSTGARNFLAKALHAGFILESEDSTGITIVGQNSMVSFNVLAYYGNDKIFTLVFKENDCATKTLIREGDIVY